MRSSRYQVERSQPIAVRHPAHRELTRTVARRLARVGRLQHPRRSRNGAKGLLHHGQRQRHIESPGDHQHCVVRLVILAVKILQILDLDVFHIAARADRVFAVVVPVKTAGQHFLHQYVLRPVFTRFHFIAHD